MGRRGNGEGSITRHKKSGLHMARYWIETKDGRKRKTIYGKKRKDVADELVKVLSDHANGISHNDENTTVGEYLDGWLKDCVHGSHQLLEAARGDKFEALYVLAVTTGMRRGELLGLKWSDVDLKNASLSVKRTLTRTDNGKRVTLGDPKTKKSRRTIRLTPQAVERLSEST